jgi:glycosyltransferase involved in cell wall biosynthesis
MYLAGVLLVVPRYLGLYRLLTPVAEWLVWYSGIPMVMGLMLALLDLLALFEGKRRIREYRDEPVGPAAKVTVALTAYNDQDSIGDAVRDFLSHPGVRRVIVVSNNSSDLTFEVAREAGALVINEKLPGYGRCVYRCYVEALQFADSHIVLCEGDRTFRAIDIEKLIPYAPHADIINGTRTVEALRENRTQLTTFMFYGNLFVAKLLEAKHLGRSTLTDVGSTFKLCRREALVDMLPHLNPDVNLEFNAHFLDVALKRGLVVVECPITFHPRVGQSKGGNTDNVRAFKVGLRMIRGMTFGWKAGP